MTEKKYTTRCGDIRYWVSDSLKSNAPCMVFLPGLTADHRLF